MADDSAPAFAMPTPLARYRRFAAIGALGVLHAATVAPSAAAPAVPAAPPAHVVHVCDCPPAMARAEREELLRDFARLGYVQGGNLELTTYDAEGADTRAGRGAVFTLEKPYGPNPYARLFAERIAAAPPQLVLASGVRVAAAARESTVAAPVVFWRITDPVGLGLVATLARPGGKLTGFSRAIEKLTVKRLELLHEMVPRARRIGFVSIEDFPSHALQAADVRSAAPRLGVEVVSYALPSARWTADELDTLFARMRRDGMEAFLLPDLNVLPMVLVDLARRHRLPTVYSLSHVVTHWGGLAAYSTVAIDSEDVVRYAVRTLRGERPGDLPVQEPARFEMILNARAARDLGLAFPRALVLRASQVIEK